MSNSQHSDSIKELAGALSKAQAQMGFASKDSTNPHFNSRYADLASVRDAIRDPFAMNGLAATHVVMENGHGRILRTILMHTSGEWLASDFPLLGDLTRPQVFGSLMTYAIRYSLAAIAGLAQDDDDGNQAQQQAETYREATPVKTKQPPLIPHAKEEIAYDEWLRTFVDDINTKWWRRKPGAKELINVFRLNKHLLKTLGKMLDQSEANNFAKGREAWETDSELMIDQAEEYCRELWRQSSLTAPLREPGGDDDKKPGA